MEKKQQKYHTGGKVLKFDRKIVNTGTKSIPLRHVYISPFWLGGGLRFP
jgi:hypothetical protein